MAEDNDRSDVVDAVVEQEDPAVEPTADQQKTLPAGPFQLSTPTFVIGGVATLLFLFYFAFGRVTVHLSGGDTERMRVRDVWATVRHDLPNVSQPSMLTAVYIVAVAMAVVGSVAGLWFALSAGPETEPSTRAASRDK